MTGGEIAWGALTVAWLLAMTATVIEMRMARKYRIEAERWRVAAIKWMSEAERRGSRGGPST